MATQVTHAALVDRVFDQYFYKYNKQEFVIGSLFPDIRYMAGVNRQITHFEDIGFQEILDEKSSFLAGILYHSFVDKTRQQWLTGNGLYELIPYDYHWTQAVKFYEDSLYFGDIKNWEVIAAYLDKILPEELNFKIDRSVILEWHKMLVDYFNLDPHKNEKIVRYKAIGMPEDIATDISFHVEVLEKNEAVVKICKQIHDEYEQILKNII